jgi:molybdenum cofactor synthesis domain-containing protein
LAKDIVSKFDVPKHKSSHMDGFAVKASDIVNASNTKPIKLRIVGHMILGKIPKSTIMKKGETYAISTGGFMPKGADTVIPEEAVEEQEWHGRHSVVIKSPLPKGSFVYFKSSDIKKGDRLLVKGSALRVQDIGLLASLHLANVPLLAKPKIAVIPTGSELTDDLEYNKSNPRKILNTNSRIIGKLIEEAGGIPLDLGVTKDDAKIIASKIKSALTIANMVITIGGSSVGKYDLVENAINLVDKASGIINHGVRLDRGRVTGLGVISKKPIIILPGPIQGAMSAFIAFVYPLIRHLAGYLCDDGTLKISATLTSSWHARKRFSNFMKIVYVKLFQSNEGQFMAEPIHGETESIMPLVRASGYIVVSEDTLEMYEGQKIEVCLLPGFSTFECVCRINAAK